MPRLNALARIRKLTEQTAKALTKELHAIESEKTQLTSDLDVAADRIRETLRQLGHTGNGHSAGKRATPSGAKKGKRIRRTLDQLKQEANAIIQFIKGTGSEGARGSEIRKHHEKIGPDLRGFVQKYSGKKLKTTGAASKMRYFVS